MTHLYSMRGVRQQKGLLDFLALYLKCCSHMAEALLGPGFLT